MNGVDLVHQGARASQEEGTRVQNPARRPLTAGCRATPGLGVKDRDSNCGFAAGSVQLS